VSLLVERLGWLLFDGFSLLLPASNKIKATKTGGLLLSKAVSTQYEMPFKLSISTFHVSVMAITPAIVSHNVRHPSW
jgi:hypothetical protein